MLIFYVFAQRVNVALFRPAGGIEQPAQFVEAEIAVCIHKLSLRINDFLYQIVADADIQVFWGFLQNGVDQVFLDDILQNGVFHIVIDVNIVAEQDFVLINDYVVHFDNRAVFSGAAQIAWNAEQRHKA